MSIELKALIVILVSYAAAGIAQAALTLAYRSPTGQQYLISDDAHRSKSKEELRWRIFLNGAVSVALIFTIMFGLGRYIYYDGSIPLCVGVPPPCEHRGQAAHAVDVLVNGEVVDRAATNASYREELASLASAAAGSNRSHRTRGAASHGLSRHATGRLLAWQGAVRGRGAV